MPDTKPIEDALKLCNEESRTLGLTYGTRKVIPGQHLPWKECVSPPQLSWNGAGSLGRFIVVCLDLDPPFPSFSVLGPALHWSQPGLKPQISTNGTSTDLIIPEDTPFIVDYAGPRPPSPSSPQRYAFLLYEQPEGFNMTKFVSPGGKKVGVLPRMRYDLRNFEREANLGPIVACNYYFSN